MTPTRTNQTQPAKAKTPAISPLDTGLWRIEQGRLALSMHPGQAQAWQSNARFVWVLAGAQSGKTCWGPWWLHREILRTADPRGQGNDYIAATATFDLFKLKLLPELLAVFEQATGMGRYWGADRVIELADPKGRFWAKRSTDRMWGRIILRAASAGGGLESSTARGAWLDECGQKDFTIETYHAVRRRLALRRGRILGTTTLYDLGWLKTEVWDAHQRVGGPSERPDDADNDVINFDSTENPAFSYEEFHQARRSMPEWRFNMMYRGLFTRPAGQIYDCFIDADVDEGGHRCRPFRLPDAWHRVAGIDFGVVNTAIGLYAIEEDGDGYPTGRLYLHRTYHAGSRNATEHVERIREIEPNLILATGGAPSEDAWRQAYLWAELPVYRPTVADVEVGIDRVYGATKAGSLVVFDTETEFIAQKKAYSRELDDRGEPTIKIKDKERYHRLDQERYMSLLFLPGGKRGAMLPFEARKHLLVGDAAKIDPPAHWNRYGGLFYADGQPSGFVLCVVNHEGAVTVDAEVSLPGLKLSAFAEACVAMLEGRGLAMQDIRTLPVLCNDDLFISRPIGPTGDVQGPALVETLRTAGLVHCMESGGDGANEWGVMAEWLRRSDTKALRINRQRCPFLSLTLPLIVGDPKQPGAPHPDSPTAVAQALCYALMLRPQASGPTPPPKPDAPDGLPDWMIQQLEAGMSKRPDDTPVRRRS